MSTQRVREEAMLAAQYAVKGFTHLDAVQLAKFHRQFRMANGSEEACERMAREALGKPPKPQGAALGATLPHSPSAGFRGVVDRFVGSRLSLGRSPRIGASLGAAPPKRTARVSFHDLREQFVRAGYDETQADQMARTAMST